MVETNPDRTFVDAETPSLRNIANGALAACAPARLLVALLFVLLVSGLTLAADGMYSAFSSRTLPESGLLTNRAMAPDWSVGDASGLREVDWRVSQMSARPAAALASEWHHSVQAIANGLASGSPSVVLSGAQHAMVEAPLALIAFDPLFGSVWLLALAVCGSVGGGALCRMTALQCGRGVKLTATEGLRWLPRVWLRLALVPITPALLVGGLVIVVFVLGLLCSIPGLNVVGGVLYGVMVFVAILAVLSGGAAFLGWPWSIAAAACGDADAMDATVRSTAYLFRHPLRSLAVAGVSLLTVAGNALLVLTVAALTMSLTHGVLSALGVGSTVHVGSDVTVQLIGAWDWIFAALVTSAILSCIADVATRGYLVLRYRCDGQDPTALDGVPLGRPAVTRRANA